MSRPYPFLPWLGVGFVGAAVGAAVASVFLRRDAIPAGKGNGKGQPSGAESAAGHPALRHGSPTTEFTRVSEAFVASFDPRTRNARWVIERVSRDGKLGNKGDRGASEFKEDKGLPVRLRSRLDDYRGSGYDRGHLAPAANHKGNQSEMDATFSLSNMSPQVGEGFNRHYWARFEKFCRDLADKYESVYIATGPLFLPSYDPAASPPPGSQGPSGGFVMRYPLIGKPPGLVAVPTHFFKVVLAEGLRDGSGASGVAAFVMPNAPIPAAVPLRAWAVAVDDLEAASGTLFFSKFMTPARRDGYAGSEQAVLLAAEADRRQAKALAGGRGSTPQLLITGNAPMTTGQPRGAPTADAPRHICAQVACELAAEDFYKAKKGSREPLPPPSEA